MYTKLLHEVSALIGRVSSPAPIYIVVHSDAHVVVIFEVSFKYTLIFKKLHVASIPYKADAHPLYKSKMSAGALMALVARGCQDVYLFDAAHEDTWDVRRRFLRAPYTTVYGKLSTAVETRGERHTMIFTIQPDIADMINDLDLVLESDELDIDIGKLIGSVKVMVGNRRVDSWEGTDIKTLIDTMCAVFKRKISRHGKKMFIPLVLAPFHSHNLLSLVGLRDTPVVIQVEFLAAVAVAAEIHGKMYFLSNGPRKAAMAYEMGIAETQWGGDHPKPMSLPYTKHRLSFDHPISMLIFWGIDKKTIEVVKLHLNGHAIYDGPIEPLERLKEERGLAHVEPLILFFSQEGPNSPYQSTVNFSRLDSVTMVIGTRQMYNHEEYTRVDTVRYYAVSVQPLSVANGLCNKRFDDQRCQNMFPEYYPTCSIDDI